MQFQVSMNARGGIRTHESPEHPGLGRCAVSSAAASSLTRCERRWFVLAVKQLARDRESLATRDAAYEDTTPLPHGSVTRCEESRRSHAAQPGFQDESRQGSRKGSPQAHCKASARRRRASERSERA